MPLPAPDASVCIQLCLLALHAMCKQAVITPAACMACARACESLAGDCMLLRGAEYKWRARACYRAARECFRLATQLRERATPGALRSTSVYEVTGEGLRLQGASSPTLTLTARKRGQRPLRHALA